VPETHRFVSRHVQQCNWLQGLEGGFDTSHLAFLHRGTVDGAPRVVPSRYEVVARDFGFVVGTGREITPGKINWTANVMAMPFHKIIATDPVGAHVWAPMDDENTMLYSIEYRPDRKLSQDDIECSTSWQGIHSENIGGGDIAVQNIDNHYLIDRELQRSGASYSGMKGLGIQDCAIQESMGPIADRTIEHLGVSDTAIIQIRRLLIRTLEEFARGVTPPGLAAASYRVRSARFALPEATPFGQAVDDFVAIDLPS
jgi:hypothetical protein